MQVKRGTIRIAFEFDKKYWPILFNFEFFGKVSLNVNPT